MGPLRFHGCGCHDAGGGVGCRSRGNVSVDCVCGFLGCGCCRKVDFCCGHGACFCGDGVGRLVCGSGNI